jgi:hypothetical protein
MLWIFPRFWNRICSLRTRKTRRSTHPYFDQYESDLYHTYIFFVTSILILSSVVGLPLNFSSGLAPLCLKAKYLRVAHPSNSYYVSSGSRPPLLKHSRLICREVQIINFPVFIINNWSIICSLMIISFIYFTHIEDGEENKFLSAFYPFGSLESDYNTRRRTDRRDEANSRFSQFCERAL